MKIEGDPLKEEEAEEVVIQWSFTREYRGGSAQQEEEEGVTKITTPPDLPHVSLGEW